MNRGIRYLMGGERGDLVSRQSLRHKPIGTTRARERERDAPVMSVLVAHPPQLLQAEAEENAREQTREEAGGTV